jgi:hypothetical protein
MYAGLEIVARPAAVFPLLIQVRGAVCHSISIAYSNEPAILLQRVNFGIISNNKILFHFQ